MDGFLKALRPREPGGRVERGDGGEFQSISSGTSQNPQSVKPGWRGTGSGNDGGPLPGAVGWRLSGGAWRRGRVSPSAPLK